VCELGDKQTSLALDLVDAANTDAPYQAFRDYALLVLATGTPLDRAITYLKDTGSPQHARGRLLLRAAEKALREAGDIE
jgi:hypothetical protein